CKSPARAAELAFEHVAPRHWWRVTEDRDPQPARRFDGKQARAPLLISNVGGDAIATLAQKFVSRIYIVGFDDYVGVRKSSTKADLHAGAWRLQLYSAAAFSIPTLSLPQAERGEELNQRVVIFGALGNNELM